MFTDTTSFVPGDGEEKVKRSTTASPPLPWQLAFLLRTTETSPPAEPEPNTFLRVIFVGWQDWGCAGTSEEGGREGGRPIKIPWEGQRPLRLVLVAFSRWTPLPRTSEGEKKGGGGVMRFLANKTPGRCRSSDGGGSYRHELHILEKFLYEPSGGQAKHTVGQEVGDLGVQADIIECIGELLLDPAKAQRAKSLNGRKKTNLLIFLRGVKEAQRELYVNSPVSWPLVPTDELRLMMRRSTSFLSRTREAGPSSDMAFPPGSISQSINFILYRAKSQHRASQSIWTNKGP